MTHSITKWTAKLIIEYNRNAISLRDREGHPAASLKAHDRWIKGKLRGEHEAQEEIERLAASLSPVAGTLPGLSRWVGQVADDGFRPRNAVFGAADQADADTRVARAKAERRRAEAIAAEQEMKAEVAENRAQLVLAEADVPQAMADAFRSGNIFTTSN